LLTEGVNEALATIEAMHSPSMEGGDTSVAKAVSPAKARSKTASLADSGTPDEYPPPKDESSGSSPPSPVASDDQDDEGGLEDNGVERLVKQGIPDRIAGQYRRVWGNTLCRIAADNETPAIQLEYLNVKGKPSTRRRQKDKRGRTHEFPECESVKIEQSMSASMMAVLNDVSLKAVYKWTVPLYLIDYAILAKDKVKQAEKDATR
jgi:hypothetical protein